MGTAIVHNGHNTPETAFVVSDYPYGFRLRCQIRYWIERKPGKGSRFCSQTSNPKKSSLVWNAPKCSTYSDIVLMVEDPSNGHISKVGLHFSASPKAIMDFWGTYGDNMCPEDAAAWRELRDNSERDNPVSWQEYHRAAVSTATAEAMS